MLKRLLPAVYISGAVSRRSGRSISVVLLCAVLAGCAPTPDLERLYQSARGNADQPPVILIPGILGSRLVDDSGREVWPGSIWQLMTSQYLDLELPVASPGAGLQRPPLYPGGLFDRAAGREYYSRIISVLQGPGGYLPGQVGVSVADARPRYYVFTFDWRQDAVRSVAALNRLIEQVKLDHGRPDLKVDVIAHSMGGLIARYYARYGTVDVLNDNEFPVSQAGARNMRRLILVGTPNLGSVEAMRSLMEGRNLGLRLTPPEVIMTMPAIYQLFPHALNHWLFTTAAEPLQRDQFDAVIWRRFEMGPWSPALRQRVQERLGPEQAQRQLAALEAYFQTQLERARRFTWALSVPEPPGGIDPTVFGGNCNLTPARLVVEEVDGESWLRLWPGQVANPVAGIDYPLLMLEPGDGTVTKASLLARDVLDPTVSRHEYLNFAPNKTFFFCENHETLTGNITFQDNLLDTLLSVD
jgi:pimeloyl-ACP methyl ester carboxylesterase